MDADPLDALGRDFLKLDHVCRTIRGEKVDPRLTRQAMPAKDGLDDFEAAVPVVDREVQVAIPRADGSAARAIRVSPRILNFGLSF